MPGCRASRAVLSMQAIAWILRKRTSFGTCASPSPERIVPASSTGPKSVLEMRSSIGRCLTRRLQQHHVPVILQEVPLPGSK
jgi:hypothetical protein